MKTEILINRSSLRRILKEKKFHIGIDSTKKLEYKLEEILYAATKLAHSNKRKTILQRDII